MRIPVNGSPVGWNCLGGDRVEASGALVERDHTHAS
jgi:hypothetical protein